MRISLNTPDPQDIATQRNSRAATPATDQARSIAEGAQVSLHDTVTVGSLVTAVLQTPETRQEKIDTIRQNLATGQYQLDAKASAEGILSE